MRYFGGKTRLGEPRFVVVVLNVGHVRCRLMNHCSSRMIFLPHNSLSKLDVNLCSALDYNLYPHVTGQCFKRHRTKYQGFVPGYLGSFVETIACTAHWLACLSVAALGVVLNTDL